MDNLTWLLIALPWRAHAVLLLGGRATDAWGHLLGLRGRARIVRRRALVLFADLLGRDAPTTGRCTRTLFSWVPAGELRVDFGLQLDQLSICFVLLITGVGSLIHLVLDRLHEPTTRTAEGSSAT